MKTSIALLGSIGITVLSIAASGCSRGEQQVQASAPAAAATPKAGEELPAPEPATKQSDATPNPAKKNGDADGDKGKKNDPKDAAPTSKVPLIPREVFFGNPDKVAPDISPDGKRLAFLAPVKGVLNIWLAPIDDVAAAQPITHDKGRGIMSFFWAYTGQHILYTQDVDGDENWNIYCIDLESDNKIRNLTPQEGDGEKKQGDPSGKDRVRAEIESVSWRFPNEILIGLNDRDPRYHDVYRLNILTGEKKLLQTNPGYRGFVIDEDYKVRFASKYLEDGSVQYYEPADAGSDSTTEIKWKEFLNIPKEDSATTNILGFDKSGETLYLADSRGRDTAALMTLDLKTGKQELLAADPRTDVGAIKSHPTENTIQAVTFYYDKRKRVYFDAEVEKDLKLASEGAEGDAGIAGWSLDDRQWIIAHSADDGPTKYFHFDRDTKKLNFLFVHRSDLKGLPLAKMHPVVIEARDGQKLVSYLTLPVDADPDGDGRPDKPLPMVLNVHGGPWARDTWGYDGEHQLLANRGYAVLAVNYRGSTGFGKNFQNIAIRQWAGTMHDDLIDSVNWAVKEGIAEKDKIAIMGGSYGGYATLVGLTFTPEVFACGVDIVGPSSLITLIESIPPYWESFRQQLTERVGDIDTPEGRKELESRSPVYHAERMKRPLLIGQGANDPRVKEAEAKQMVSALQGKGIPVTYVLFPDEGHGFARPENRLAFYAVTEAFLARHLGGRAEPIGTAFEGSKITVPEGAEDIPGLEAALR